MDVYATGGDNLGDVPLSEKQLAAIESGAEIVVQYHTPQLLRGALGERSGSFILRKEGQRIVTDAPDAVRKYADLADAIRAAREQN